MLPSNLLRARISQGKIQPMYALFDPNTLRLVNTITDFFSSNIGKKKKEILLKIKLLEDKEFDFKLVRGFLKLIERRCVFEADSIINPVEARMQVFEEGSKKRLEALVNRNQIINNVAIKINVKTEELEKALFCDIDDELILKKYEPIEPKKLVKQYNLSLIQTLIFKSLRMKFFSSSNWKEIFRSIKKLGLIYSIERVDEKSVVTVEGPLSLLKMTDRYGTTLAKIVPIIVSADEWWIQAEVLSNKKSKIYQFESDSKISKIISESYSEILSGKIYDSSLEERFANDFNSYNSSWLLKREPELLSVGEHVMIPDFSFERRGVKVYLEIVGFWTQEYLERKIRKLEQLRNVSMIVAIDENLGCSKIKNFKGPLIIFKKKVPIKPIIEYLKNIESIIIDRELKLLQNIKLKLTKDVENIDEVANEYNMSVESIREKFRRDDIKDYRIIGDQFISKSKLNNLEKKIDELTNATLPDYETKIESLGFKNTIELLEALGYTIEWINLDPNNTIIKKRR